MGSNMNQAIENHLTPMKFYEQFHGGIFFQDLLRDWTHHSYVFQPLRKIWKSVGMILPNWMESHKIHVPNHQPVYIIIYNSYIYMSTLLLLVGIQDSGEGIIRLMMKGTILVNFDSLCQRRTCNLWFWICHVNHRHHVNQVPIRSNRYHFK